MHRVRRSHPLIGLYYHYGLSLVTMTWPCQGIPSAPSCELPCFLKIIKSQTNEYLLKVSKNLWLVRERSLCRCIATI